MKTSLSNFNNVTLETDVTVITLDDNLTHTYFSELSWEKDNAIPMGIAKIIMPYSESIEKYWSTYSGTVVIHANLNNVKNKKEKKMKKHKSHKMTELKNPKKATSKIKIEKEKEKEHKIRIKNDEYNYSFIGKIHRFKQTGKTFTVYLEDLGWKFMQKVPNDFRKTFVAGQTLDNTFQAICEFMGVEFAYSIEDLSSCNFSVDGYSVEKDGAVIEDTPSILEEFNKTEDEKSEEEGAKTTDENMADNMNSNTYESSGLIEYQKEQENKTTNEESSKKETDTALNQTATNLPTNENTEVANNEEKLEKYEEEFDEKIQDLFKGNTLYDSNISDPILNYDWITVEPKPVATESSTNASTTPTGTTNGTPNSTTGDANSSEGTSSYEGVRANYNVGGNKTGWYDGQLYFNGKIYLNDSYIKSLTPSQAWGKYISGQGTYTMGTLNRLKARSLWMLA